MYTIKVYDDDYRCIRCFFVKTYEEAEEVKTIIEKYPIRGMIYDISIVENDISTPNEIEQELRERRIAYLEKEIKEDTVIVSDYAEIVKELEEIKSLLDPFVDSVDDYLPLIPQMWKEIQKTDFDITLYDGTYKYSPNGNKSRDDREVYQTEIIWIMPKKGGIVRFNNGEYKIDKEIKSFQYIFSNESSSLNEMKEELNKLKEA